MKAIGERSADTDRLVVALRGVNGEISYSNLAKQADLAIPRAKALLTSARRIVLRDDGLTFGAIRGFGVKRLNLEEKINDADHDLKKMHRASGRAIKKHDTIDYGLLKKDQQHRVTTQRTVFNIIRMNSAVKSKKPETKEATSSAPLPNTALLARMK